MSAVQDRSVPHKVQINVENNTLCAQARISVTAAHAFLLLFLMTSDSNFVFWVPDPQALFPSPFFFHDFTDSRMINDPSHKYI